jgi:hypothetical protein
MAASRRGRGETISAWVTDAVRLKLEHDRRIEALAAFVAAYEAEHGEISREEMDRAARRARSRAVTVRGPGTPRPVAGRRRRGAA